MARAEWLLPVLGLVLLQTFLALREPIFSPIDELQHTDYVRTIAIDNHLPVYGSARVDRALLAVQLREYPRPFDPTGFVLSDYEYFDYEAIQFPLYYVMAAPAYAAFSWDPRVAVYALRLQNVGYSAGLLLLLMLILKWVFPRRREIAAFVPLMFLAMPGVSMRESQVTNQVLAAVLLAALFALMLQKDESRVWRLALAEGLMFGLAVMTKITVVGAGPSLLVAWGTRKAGLRPRLIPGAIGFGIAIAPWVVWSAITYHFPLPWVTTHLNVTFCQCAPPTTRAGWLALAHEAWVNFVLPEEWAGLAGQYAQYAASPHTAAMRLGLLIAPILGFAAVGAAVWQLRKVESPIWRATLLAGVAITGVVIGILGLDISLHRFSSTDLREIYVFAGPVVILVGGLSANFDRRWVLLTAVVVILVWLVIDAQMYAGTCAWCPPARA